MTPYLKSGPEETYAAELTRLAEQTGPRPAGWLRTPRAVRDFICGRADLGIERKFYGDDQLVERCIITLAGNRALMLVGEPGTAKTMLSELLAAAISGDSTLTIQGTAGTTEDQIKYTWNYALLLAEGPGPRALVPAPLYLGMLRGAMVRFEELTRCPAEIQDTLVSILSDKVMLIPELDDAARVMPARSGFNLIATANTRDRGVHEMSSALKRRFNFETVHPILELEQEVDLVTRQSRLLCEQAGLEVELTEATVTTLVMAFQDLRRGVSQEGIPVERPTAVMSTAEAVSVAFSACLDACYYGAGAVTGELLARHLSGAALKDNQDDQKKLKHYFEVVIRPRSREQGGIWQQWWQAHRSHS